MEANVKCSGLEGPYRAVPPQDPPPVISECLAGSMPRSLFSFSRIECSFPKDLGPSLLIVICPL